MRTPTMFDIAATTADRIDPQQLIATLTETEKVEGYIVIGHSINGGRYYGPRRDLYADAQEDFSGIGSVVQYFGGGQVSLYAITNLDFYVMAYQNI